MTHGTSSRRPPAAGPSDPRDSAHGVPTPDEAAPDAAVTARTAPAATGATVVAARAAFAQPAFGQPAFAPPTTDPGARTPGGDTDPATYGRGGGNDVNGGIGGGPEAATNFRGCAPAGSGAQTRAVIPDPATYGRGGGSGSEQATNFRGAGSASNTVTDPGGPGRNALPGSAARPSPRAIGPAPVSKAPPAPTVRPRHRAFRPASAAGLVAADGGGLLAGAAAATAAGAPGLGVTAAAGLVVVMLAAQRRAGLYRPGFAPSALAEVPAVMLRAGAAWGVAAALSAAGSRAGALGWAALLAAFAVTAPAACALRALTYALRRRTARRHPRSTLIVDAGAQGRRIAAALHEHPEYGMRPVGIVTPDPGAEPADPALRLLAAALHAQTPGLPPDLPLPVLTGHGEITRAVIQNSVRHAVVVGPPTLDSRTTATVRLLAAQGCCLWQLTSDRGQVPPAHLWGFACRRLELEPYPVPRPGRRAKRALDAVLAGAALLLLTPVLAGCALAMRLADGPGVIFRQERIGLGGRSFTLLKFRTLRPRTERESATRWSVVDDQRMSRAGRLLRRTSLDELPQLWNVLRGDMSLVGPRPERPYFVEQFSRAHPGYRDRHRMPAGITGLAQVHGLRGDTSIADRARFDNHYIDSWSWWQDVAIMLRTVGSLFRLGGS
jgi:exopolysaccharide biosynthesis polyprenyl glycosylphosphotransferase